MKRRWFLRAAATDKDDQMSVALARQVNHSNDRFWFRRSAEQAVHFHESMLAPSVRFYVIRVGEDDYGDF